LVTCQAHFGAQVLSVQDLEEAVAVPAFKIRTFHFPFKKMMALCFFCDREYAVLKAG